MLFNWGLFRNPSNWFVIGTMVVIALFGVHFALVLIHGPLTGPQKLPSNVTADK